MAKKEPGFKDRNDILKTLTASGSFGWMKLIVAQDKLTQRKFLRLKKYFNWYSIKSVTELNAIQDLIGKGAEEVSWKMETTSKYKITESDNENVLKDRNQIPVKITELNVPEEIVDFFEENPDVIEKFINLKIQGYDFDYIFELLSLVDKALLNSNERIRVAFKEVLQKIAKEDAKGMQELSDLMGKYNLLQISTITNLVRQRLETIATFEAMIQDERTFEINTDKSIHRILEKNMWLIDEQFWIAHSNSTLRKFIGDEIETKHKKYKLKRPDFACVDFENKLTILELKRPKVELKKEELDQAELYLRIITAYKAETYSSIKVILLGNKISNEAKEIIPNRKNVEIKTYQEFLMKTKKRYTKYLEAIDEEIP